MRTTILGISAALLLSVSTTGAQATTIFADTVIDSFNSGAGSAGTLGFPYGGTLSSFPDPLPDFSNVLDGDINSFVSLATGSFVTLGFSTGVVFDGAGNDIFIAETGSASELADIFISDDFGLTFTYLGTANGGTVTEFDLASIAYTGNVNAVRVVGLDSLGGSPGFDLAYIEGLEGSITIFSAPAPAPAILLLTGFALLGAARRCSASPVWLGTPSRENPDSVLQGLRPNWNLRKCSV
jgi:hypothetical protein